MTTATEAKPASDKAPAMVPASTELPLDVDAKVKAFCEANERTRAYVLRKIITEWADKQPAPKRK